MANSQVRAYLENGAVDIGPPGRDTGYGTGRLILGAPPGGGGGGGDAYTYWVPVAAHAPGAGGSQWRTDLGTLVRSNNTANLTITLHTSSGNISGVTGAITGNGQGNGTFGQFLGGVQSGDTLRQGEKCWLPQLIQATFQGDINSRTNIGVANTGPSQATTRITLFDTNGNHLTTFSIDIPKGQVKQENEPFKNRTNRNSVLGYATMEVVSGSGVVAYASVIDTTTGDATTIPMLR